MRLFFSFFLPLALVLSLSAKALESYPEFVKQQGWNELEELGYWLFADKRLSGDNKTACISCHQPKLGWSDGLPRAVGFQGKVLDLRTPTLIGLGRQDDLGHPMFWNGRAENMLEQALGPIRNPNEMNQNVSQLIQELSQVPLYKEKFARVFGNALISEERLAIALVAFERTIQAPRIDALQEGESEQPDVLTLLNSKGVLTLGNVSKSGSGDLGKELFLRHCAFCHRPDSNLSDGLFHDIGLQTEDIGRAFLYQEDSSTQAYRLQRFKHKTPTLWGVAQRGGPYMHNGSLPDLRSVLEHYNNGGSFQSPAERRQRLATLNPAMRPLNLSESDLEALETFLTKKFRVDFQAYPLPDFLK